MHVTTHDQSVTDNDWQLLKKLDAVASLSSSAVVAGAPLVIYPLKTRQYDASHNQPFHHKQSAAVTLQTTSTATSSTAIALQTTSTTTSLQPSRCRRPLLRPVHRRHRRRTADADADADADNYHNTTIPQYQNTISPQMNCRLLHYRQLLQYRHTADAPLG